jgi:hypothetical protein
MTITELFTAVATNLAAAMYAIAIARMLRHDSREPA